MSGAHSSGTAAPARGALRWLRGTLVGLVAVALAATGHALGGGTLPGDGRLLALLAGAVLVAVALSGRRWSMGALLLVLLGTQVVLHVAFVAGGHTHLMPGMGADGVGLPMLAGHLLAALATAALLRRGEEWCWALVDLLGAPLVAPRLGPVPVRPTARVSREVEAPVVRRDHARDVSRRGPPALLPV